MCPQSTTECREIYPKGEFIGRKMCRKDNTKKERENVL